MIGTPVLEPLTGLPGIGIGICSPVMAVIKIIEDVLPYLKKTSSISRI